jgi:uncharacterized protein (TIGR03083 family)
MSAQLDALAASVDRLRGLVQPLGDDDLQASAYPAEWSVADVLSHIGSGAVIHQRRLEDALAGQPTPDDISPPIWDEWNAKSPRAKADDCLVADQALLERVREVTSAQEQALRIPLGPLTLTFEELVAFRLNEHAVHTWDIEVTFDRSAVVQHADLIVDHLDLIARFTAKPTGSERTISVATIDPTRLFTVELTPEAVTFQADDDGQDPDLTLPAEAFCRLVYGRLDPDHTPAVTDRSDGLAELRRVWPGP